MSNKNFFLGVSFISLILFSCNYNDARKINSFTTLDNALIKTNKDLVLKNENTCKRIDSIFHTDSITFLPYYYRALAVKENSNRLLDYVESIKMDIATKDKSFSSNINDNYDVSNYFFSNTSESDTSGKGYELKNKIKKYKLDLFSLTYIDDRHNFKFGLDIRDVYSSHENKMISWQRNCFDHNSTAAVMAILSTIENEIRNDEVNVITSIYNHMVNIRAADSLPAQIK